MKRTLSTAIAALALVPAAASAYLSQDGTRLANGGGTCAVCIVGWESTGTGYKCAVPVTTDSPNCRPAARVVPVGPPVIYDDRGTRLVTKGPAKTEIPVNRQ